MKRIVVLSVFFQITLAVVSQKAILEKSCDKNQVGSSNTSNLIQNLVTVDYQYHKGRCVLKNGDVLYGFFRFNPYKSDLFNGSFLVPEMLNFPFIELKGTSGIKTRQIYFSQIVSMAIYGKDSLTNILADSTYFLYSKQNHTLLRHIYDDGLQIYDELYIIDELLNKDLNFWQEEIYTETYSTGPLTKPSMLIPVPNIKYKRTYFSRDCLDSLLFARLRTDSDYYIKWGNKILKLKKWEDLRKKVTLDPYIYNLADTLRKLESHDIYFGLLFSLSKDKLSLVPFFRPIEITLKTGVVLTGLGYVQPVNFEGFEYRGIVHFYNGKEFVFFKPTQIFNVLFESKEYIPIYDSWNKFYVMAYRWDFENKEYRIVKEITTNDNFFNFSYEYKYRIYQHKKDEKWTWLSGQGIVNDFMKYGER